MEDRFVAHDIFSLAGKVIAVVGAGSGIGQAIALGAADQGAAHVACLDMNEPSAAATAAQIAAKGAKASAVAMDIADIPQTVSVVTSDFIKDTMSQRMLDAAAQYYSEDGG